MKQIFSDYAIVLRASPFREADIRISALTSQHGQLIAVAHGAKSSKKRFMGGIDLFDCGLIAFSHAGKENSILSLDCLGERIHWPHMRSDLLKYSAGVFLLEVTSHFAPEEDPEGAYLFPLLKDALSLIDSASAPEEVLSASIYYLLRSLNISGLHPLAGGVPFAEETRAWLEDMLGAEHPLRAPAQTFYIQVLRQLGFYIEAFLGRKVNTLEGLQSIAANRASKG